MNKILVPLDGSPLADGILPHVERLLALEPAEVTLLTVLPPPEPEEVPGQAAAQRKLSEAHLEGVRLRLEQKGAKKVQTVVRQGDPAAEIVFAQEDGAPDLVAMSSHGRTGVLRWLRGSVAERVLRTARAPLLLLTARGLDEKVEPRFRRILVPLEDDATSAAVLPLVTRFARLHGAEVLLLRVEGAMLVPRALVLTPEELGASLRPHVEALEKEGLSVRTQIAHGDPASEVLDLADREDVDLIAMATHGRTGAARLLEGSVSEKVLRACRRPLLIFRAPR
ncbi:MAG: universal stress protein [Planctomycetes bacterium]|nr:universal stress protein [Planctomycetota bacterium]